MSPFRLYIYSLVVCLLPESRCFGLKCALLRWAGAEIGSNVRIYSSVRILGNGRLVIGDDVHIGAGTMIYVSSPAKIQIGSHVDIGPEVMLVTGTHKIDWNGLHVAGEGESRDIVIGDGSWLCVRSVVLSGVSVPFKTIVAACALVNKSVLESNSMLVGVPAKVVAR